MSDHPIGRTAPTLRHPVLDESPALRAKAHALGLTCPDTLFLGWRHSHRFCCAHGHEFMLTPSAVVRALKRCPKCDEEDRFLILQARTAQLGLQLLRQDATVGGHRYRLRCKQGHEWTSPRVVVHCPTCKPVQPSAPAPKRAKVRGLERLHNIAREHRGVCLDSEYRGYLGRHRFACAEGHQWEAQAGDVLRGAWCPECASAARFRRKYGPEVFRALLAAAEARGGELLTTEPLAPDKPMQFRCANRHTWWAGSTSVLGGSWCAKCARSEQRRTIAHAVAAEHGGRCLSHDFSNAQQPLFWACLQAGHVWRAQLRAVRRGRWCQECAKERRGTGLFPRLGGPLPFLFYDEAPLIMNAVPIPSRDDNATTA